MGANRLNNTLRGLIARIPKRYVIGLGKLLGGILLLVDGTDRRVVLRNLRFTHTDLSQDQIRQLCRRIFQHLGITFLETCQIATFSREDILAGVRVLDEDHLRRALKEHRGVVAITAHLGNWEMALQIASCYFESAVTTVVRRAPLARLDRWLTHFRTRFGAKVIPQEDAFPDMVKVLRRGEILNLMVDQGRASDGVDVTFFGRKATATRGAALVAIRCRSPVVMGSCVRAPDGELILKFYPPLDIQRTGDLRADVQINTQIMSDAVERAIREHPEQWCWNQRKWKKHYPDLYPEFFASKERKRRRSARADV
ncbi:MAG TPA: lysophospholipid acyltransferase family protein [Syntrophobacteria bacterium]|nr:lysophospholipid acyltransferase family protein [Syntrophobacteria bacterium]